MTLTVLAVLSIVLSSPIDEHILCLFRPIDLLHPLVVRGWGADLESRNQNFKKYTGSFKTIDYTPAEQVLFF